MADLHQMTISGDDGRSSTLKNLLEKDVFRDAVKLSDEIIATLGDELTDVITKKFRAKKLLLARPVLLSKLVSPEPRYPSRMIFKFNLKVIN